MNVLLYAFGDAFGCIFQQAAHLLVSGILIIISLGVKYDIFGNLRRKYVLPLFLEASN